MHCWWNFQQLPIRSLELPWFPISSHHCPSWFTTQLQICSWICDWSRFWGPQASSLLLRCRGEGIRENPAQLETYIPHGGLLHSWESLFQFFGGWPSGFPQHHCGIALKLWADAVSTGSELPGPEPASERNRLMAAKNKVQTGDIRQGIWKEPCQKVSVGTRKVWWRVTREFKTGNIIKSEPMDPSLGEKSSAHRRTVDWQHGHRHRTVVPTHRSSSSKFAYGWCTCCCSTCSFKSSCRADSLSRGQVRAQPLLLPSGQEANEKDNLWKSGKRL